MHASRYFPNELLDATAEPHSLASPCKQRIIKAFSKPAANQASD
jgi:hypothetical protein